MINTVVVMRQETVNSELVKLIKHDSRFTLIGSLESFSVMMDVASGTRVDCVICDAIAQDMDFHECSIRMEEADLEKIPKLIVMCPSVSNKIFERFIELGAFDVIQTDTDMITMLNRLASDMKHNVEPVYSVEETMEAAAHNIKKWLMLLDISPKLNVYKYIIKAMLLCREDPGRLSNVSKNLYGRIAFFCDTRPENVERAIRHGILSMWKKASPRFINELFGNPVKAQSVRPPTNREFLAALFERLYSIRSGSMQIEMAWAAEPPAVYDPRSQGEKSLP